MENIKAQFKNLPPWQKYFLVLGLPILLSLYIWFILISPVLEETNKLKLEKEQVEKEIENIRNSIRPAILMPYPPSQAKPFTSTTWQVPGG